MPLVIRTRDWKSGQFQLSLYDNTGPINSSVLYAVSYMFQWTKLLGYLLKNGVFCCSFYCAFISFQIQVKSFDILSIIWNELYDVILLANS